MLVWDCRRCEWERFVKNNILSGRTNLKLSDFYGWQDMYPLYTNVYSSYRGKSSIMTRRNGGLLNIDSTRNSKRPYNGSTRVVLTTRVVFTVHCDLRNESKLTETEGVIIV